jgi:hypothetical protein
MKVEIRYAARYAYARRVTFSPHIYRLIPKVDRALKLRRFDFRTNAGAVVNWRRDIFDNEVASVFYPKAARNPEERVRLPARHARTARALCVSAAGGARARAVSEHRARAAHSILESPRDAKADRGDARRAQHRAPRAPRL